MTQLFVTDTITNCIINEKERTSFFLLQALFLILVAYDNHVDCIIRKALCCSKVCPNKTLEQELSEEEEPEVVAVKKHLAEKRDAFVELCKEAPGGFDENPFLQGLLEIIKDSEEEVLASVDPNFVQQIEDVVEEASASVDTHFVEDVDTVVSTKEVEASASHPKKQYVWIVTIYSRMSLIRRQSRFISAVATGLINLDLASASFNVDVEMREVSHDNKSKNSTSDTKVDNSTNLVKLTQQLDKYSNPVISLNEQRLDLFGQKILLM
ncbi:hypothetical protein BD770DRAFT_469487 [Pilaira anomala]|nr:hypothetical protein BD770DRAFT_469487 [Pilaira anomala]